MDNGHICYTIFVMFYVHTLIYVFDVDGFEYMRISHMRCKMYVHFILLMWL